MRHFIFNGILLPLFSALTPLKGWKVCEEFLSQDFDPPELRKARQLEKLQQLVEHAYKHTKFWHKRFDAIGLTPSDIRTLDDIRLIPIMTKQNLRDNWPDGIIADNYKVYRISNTSGTSGRRIFIAQNRDDFNARYAAVMRARKLFDSFPGETMVRFTPNECQPAMPDGSVPKHAWKKWLFDRSLNELERRTLFFTMMEKEIVYPILHRRRDIEPLKADFSIDDVAQAVKFIERVNPELLLIYPLYAVILCKFMRARNHRPPKIKTIDYPGGCLRNKSGISSPRRFRRQFIIDTAAASSTAMQGSASIRTVPCIYVKTMLWWNGCSTTILMPRQVSGEIIL